MSKIPASSSSGSAAVAEQKYFLTYEEFLGMKQPVPSLVIFGPMILYALLVKFVFPTFAPKTDEQLKFLSSLRKYHNYGLCYFSFACFIPSLAYMLMKDEFGWIGSDQYKRMLCSEPEQWFKVLYYVFTASKIWEWGDTFFIVAIGNTPLSEQTLHVFHHATTLSLYLLMANQPGMLKNGILLNSLVHTLMYYFFVSPSAFPKWFKIVITTSQIVQLAYGSFAVWHMAPTYCPEFKDMYEKHFLTFLSPYFMAPMFMLLFIKMFIESYILGKAKAKKSGAAGAGAGAGGDDKKDKVKKM